MAINKWRFARYEDDGVSAYECLKCKAQWAMRGTPGPFCSYCGTKWDGELVWNTEERENLRHQIAGAIYANRPKPSAYWVIESRVLYRDEKTGVLKPWVHEETDGWSASQNQPHGGYDVNRYSAKIMSAILADMRRWATNDGFTKLEYRVVRKDAVEGKTVA